MKTEWLNSNAYRAYPIKEDMLRRPQDVNGVIITDVLLPNYLLVDFVLTLAAPTATRVYLSNVTYVGDLLVLSFADEFDAVIGQISLQVSAHAKNTGYTLAGSGDQYEDALGRVVLGDLSNLAQDLQEGQYTFALSTTELEARTIRPSVRGVRSLQINNQGSNSGYIYGHVKLVAGNNVQLTYSPGDNAIRVDAIGGANLNEECPCTSIAPLTNVIRTINGLAIEDVWIGGDDQCVTVTTEGDRILIADKCSEPCCDCPELKLLTDSLKILDGTVKNLEDYARQLDEKIRSFVTTYILAIVP